MGADGAELGGLLSHHDMAAIAALPDHIAIAGEDQAFFAIGQQLAIAFFMFLFNLGHAGKEERNMIKALFLGFLGEAGIHIGPFVVFAFRGRLQIFFGGADTIQQLEPDLSMLFFIIGGFFKDIGNLDVAILARLGGKIGILVAGFAFAGKCSAEILFGLASLEFHDSIPPIFSLRFYFTLVFLK